MGPARASCCVNAARQGRGESRMHPWRKMVLCLRQLRPRHWDCGGEHRRARLTERNSRNVSVVLCVRRAGRKPSPALRTCTVECMQLLVQPLGRKLQLLKFVLSTRPPKCFQFLEERCVRRMHQGTRLFSIVRYLSLNLHLSRCSVRSEAKAGVGVVRLILGGGQHDSG
jgi:hypothetical protein